MPTQLPKAHGFTGTLLPIETVTEQETSPQGIAPEHEPEQIELRVRSTGMVEASVPAATPLRASGSETNITRPKSTDAPETLPTQIAQESAIKIPDHAVRSAAKEPIEQQEGQAPQLPHPKRVTPAGVNAMSPTPIAETTVVAVAAAPPAMGKTWVAVAAAPLAMGESPVELDDKRPGDAPRTASKLPPPTVPEAKFQMATTAQTTPTVETARAPIAHVDTKNQFKVGTENDQALKPTETNNVPSIPRIGEQAPSPLPAGSGHEKRGSIDTPAVKRAVTNPEPSVILSKAPQAIETTIQAPKPALSNRMTDDTAGRLKAVQSELVRPATAPAAKPETPLLPMKQAATKATSEITSPSLEMREPVLSLSRSSLDVSFQVLSPQPVVAPISSLPPAAPQQVAQAQTQALIQAQVVEAVRTSSNNDIEVRLEPEELGRLRIIMSPREGGMHVLVLAERSETLDLMRRHSDEFGGYLSDGGYKDAEIEFKAYEDPDEFDDETADTVNVEAMQTDPTKTQQGLVDGRLDIRF